MQDAKCRSPETRSWKRRQGKAVETLREGIARQLERTHFFSERRSRFSERKVLIRSFIYSVDNFSLLLLICVYINAYLLQEN